ncbi:type II toxin-antitoxin system PemK/MazF family toxin [Sphaerisporangium sp. NPDC088356]|uniref:type II toxin-antitoxin system PemK/MazF family toxin n=1 Tax=Sphaerisporangium sp. NPDC088356 TaxID=3154871 RepID=UPI0034386D60
MPLVVVGIERAGERSLMVSDRLGAVLVLCVVLLVAAGVTALLVRDRIAPRRRGASRPGRKPSPPGRKQPIPGRKGRPSAGPGRRPLPVHSRPPSPAWDSRPAPGQIWWADVPYSDGSGSKVRPCLVVRTHPRKVEVLKITSQDKSDRSEYLAIPTAGWDPHATKDSWLDLSETHLVGDGGFRSLAATSCDARTWKRVTRVQDTGWVYEG